MRGEEGGYEEVRDFSSGDKNVLGWAVVMIAQLFKYTKIIKLYT